MSWDDRTASNPQHRAIVLLRMLFVIKLSPGRFHSSGARHPPSRGPGKVGGPGATKHQQWAAVRKRTGDRGAEPATVTFPLCREPNARFSVEVRVRLGEASCTSAATSI